MFRVFCGMRIEDTRQGDKLLFIGLYWICWKHTVGEPFMAPVTQYVFAETLI